MKKKRKRKKEKGRGKGKRTVSRMRKQVYKSTDNQQEKKTKMIDQIEEGGAEDTNNEDTAGKSKITTESQIDLISGDDNAVSVMRERDAQVSERT